MNDSFFVRRSQPVCDLQRIVQGLARSNRSAAQTVPQRFALQQFRNDVRRTLARANVEHSQNVRMIQSSGGQRLLLKPAHAVGIKRKCLRQHLDRNVAAKTGIAGAINLSHAARAQKGNNFVGTKLRARSEVHKRTRL